MNSRLSPVLSVTVLALALCSVDARADLMVAVTGTNATGVLGGAPVKPTFTINTLGSSAADAGNVGGWDFDLTWDPSALDFDPTNSSIHVNGAAEQSLPDFLTYLESIYLGPVPDVTVNQGAGFYSFSWLDNSPSFDHPLAIGVLTDSVVFTGVFTIKSGLAENAQTVISVDGSQFVDDTTLQPTPYTMTAPDTMRVTRAPKPTPAPEPGVLGLLLGGLGVLGAARRRRKTIS
jgi:hypothetical protein